MRTWLPPSASLSAIIGLTCAVAPLAFGQVPLCQVTTQLPSGSPVATLVMDVHVNSCFANNGDPNYPCCGDAAASADLPAGQYIVTLDGNACSTEGGTCNYDGTGTGGGPARLPIAWGTGSCGSHSAANSCLLGDPRAGGGPLLINHPGGPIYCWRNDNYSGDNYGLVTIKFYSAACPTASPTVTSRIFNSGKAIELVFRPDGGMTLADAASICGYIHFNWLSIVTAHPRPSVAAMLPIFDPLPVDQLLPPRWHDVWPYYWDEPPAPLYANPAFLLGNPRNTPDAYTLRFEDNPYDADYAGPGAYMKFRTFLVGLRSLTDPEIICFGSRCGIEWKSNNNGTTGTGVEFANLDETTGGTGGIFDVRDVGLEELSMAERSLLISAGVTNIDFKKIPLDVDLDIKPVINVRSKGNIPVAVLSTVDFDATSIDPASVKLGPSGAAEIHRRGHIEDVNNDGLADLVLHFATPATGIQCGDNSAILTGMTLSGQLITGSDAIKTVGCK